MLFQIKTLSENYDVEVVSRYHSIKNNMNHSERRINEICLKVKDDERLRHSGVKFIAVAGSYARMEASTSSDLDAIVVVDKDQNCSDAHSSVMSIIRENGFDEPNPRGVFSQAITEKKLISVAGSVEETYGDLSRRILLLLESKPIFGIDEYNECINGLISIYGQDVIIQDGRKTKNFVFLLNDIIRYFRTICVNYQYTKNETEWGKWPLRNIKLRHSRVLMYMSLVMSIGYLSQYHASDKLEILRALIRLEPLRRLAVVYGLSGDFGFFRVAGYYNVFLDSMNNSEVRENLKDIDYANRYNSREFSILKANSDAFSSELLRFLDARRGIWSDRFFEYLVS